MPENDVEQTSKKTGGEAGKRSDSHVRAWPRKHVPITRSDTAYNHCDMIAIIDGSTSGIVVIQFRGDADGEKQPHFIDADHPIIGDIIRVWDTNTTVADADMMGFSF